MEGERRGSESKSFRRWCQVIELGRAGEGDTVLVEQMYEYPYWGAADSNPTDDPNPRLEAYIAAARRGARVRILLDSYYDDPGDVRSNVATCAYVNDIAGAEGLDLACKRTNPTGTGIHNKMVLAFSDGNGYAHTGSINGSENSSKSNRELAVQVQSDAAYRYLADVFWYDWGEEEQHFVFLPLVVRNYVPPTPYPWTGQVTNRFQNCNLPASLDTHWIATVDWRVICGSITGPKAG